ncbi:MAG TPA: adenylate/guanylate cyclase domain-containing protein [Myxococcota bacterium]|nr:adenylate/guanylate cyclase domain-containing protein [Myxococcota bacterium]
MGCPACGKANPAEARFCMQCGEPLGRRCSHCGDALPLGADACPGCGLSSERASLVADWEPRAYTPRHLVRKILSSRSALEGELKRVTVLFVDVQGSVELSSRVDPEEWHQIIDGFFRILTDGVHRFEGTVNQYTGDGVMALFGAPIAHEDHAQRACRSALRLREDLARYAEELRRARGLDLCVRMGLHSGEVVIGKIGDDLRMDYTAQGLTVGLAARMQQIAGPGQICLTGEVAAQVAGYFELEDRGRLPIKGVPEPVAIFTLRGEGALRTRFEVARERGLSRLVGRSAELAALDEILAAVSEGRGRVVAVEGEAGVGKSRLCYEFAQRCRSRGIGVIEAHGGSHGQAIPFLLILDLMRDYFAIGAGDAAPEAQRKISEALLSVDAELGDRLPLVFAFLGVSDAEHPEPSMEPEARQSQLFNILRRVIRHHGREGSGVILLDDLHRIDRGSRAFLEQIVEVVTETRILLLTNFRPEFRATWLEGPSCERIPLAPLDLQAARELIAEHLGEDASIRELSERIRDRTGGNPFFIEELIRSVVESGALVGARGAHRLASSAAELRIPDTVQTVLAARIDRLPGREKSVLQAAAVLGKVFSRSLVERVAELPADEVSASLRALEEAQFVHRRSSDPDATYVFVHPLTQEVAYGAQLAGARRRRHAHAARLLAESESRFASEKTALVAHHWEYAGETLLAADAGARAARWSGRNDPSQSFRQWMKVRELTESLTESPEAQKLLARACAGMLNFGWREGLSEEAAARLFSQGIELARRSGDSRRQAMLLSSYGRILGTIADADAYLEHARQGARIAQGVPDVALGILIDSTVAQALRHAGRLQESLALVEEVSARATREPDAETSRLGFSPYFWLLGQRAQTLLLLGRLSEAQADLERLTATATEWHQTDLLEQAQRAAVELHWLRGDPEAALAQATRTVELAEEGGNPYSIQGAYEVLGLAYLTGGRSGEAAGALERALACARGRRVGLEFEGGMLAKLAEAQRMGGDLEGARTTAELARDVSRRRRTRVLECQAELVLGRILLRSPSERAWSEGVAALRHALALVERTGARALEPFLRVELAEAARLCCDAGGLERELRTARELFEEMGATRRAAALATGLAPGAA